MTVTVEPGVRLVDLQRALAKRAQFLPLDPACGDGATVGGVLAANASGPLRHAFGTARDWLIGLRVVHADGSASKSGGRVVKNVAGYDMHKLHVGAHGSLGLIVEATFKVAPLAAAQRTVAYSCESARAACEMATAVWNAGLALQRMEVLSPEAASHVVRVPAWTLLVEAAGGAGAVDRSDRNLRAVAARGGGAPIAMADDSAWRRWREAFQPRDMFLRTTVLPSEAADTIDTMAAATSAPARLSATVASGVVRARVDEIDDDTSISLIEGLRRSLPVGAALAAESASPAVRQRIDVFGPARGDIEIMRRLKEQFDPRGVLAPGRVLGRL
jgi:glycolate oxidase FAD binding subunit